jgi:hypothetical protein
MDHITRRVERPKSSGRLRSALTAGVHASLAAVACALWIGLAVPDMQLLPGVDSLASQSVAISLQSALLGIDDGGPNASLASAERALGLSTSGSLHNLLGVRFTSVGAGHATLVTQLDARARALEGANGAPTNAPRTSRVSAHVQPPVQTPIAQTTTGPSTPTPAPPTASPAPRAEPRAPRPRAGAPTPGPTTTPSTAPTPLALQTISFTSTPLDDAVVGGPAYHVAATATSGLPVSFSADATSAGICVVVGSEVTPVGVGTCMIDAAQAGNARFLAAPAVQQSFSIGSVVNALSIQLISFVSTPPASPVVGGAPYVAVAAASSGLPVHLWPAPESADICVITGTTVWLVGAGTCTILADQNGDEHYHPAVPKQQSFDVGLVAQTVSFTSTPPVGLTVGGGTYTVAAVATSGLTVAFSADSASAAVCAVTGTTVTALAAGTCTIDANQFGDIGYDAAPQVQQSFAVGSGAPSVSSQTINFASTAPVGAVVGGSAYAVVATASSGLPVSLSADPASVGVCTVFGSSISLVGVGTCVVDASQPGNGSYLAAPQAQQSFAVGRNAQTISFSSNPPGSAVVGGTYGIAATATSGLAVSFAVTPSSAGVCTVAGPTVSLVGAGTCTVNADQSGNATYQPAVQVQQSFSVSVPSLSVQSINFTSAAPAGASVGGALYAVSATASSGLAVTLSVDAASAAVCTLSGSTVTLVGAGTCTVDANQSGDGSYLPAPQAQQSFVVALATQAIGYTSTPPSPGSVGATYAVSATASSGLAVAFSATPSSAGICSVSGTTVSLDGAGTCTIDAGQSGDSTYQAAQTVQQSFSVTVPSLSVQSITFTSSPPASATVGGSSYLVSAVASSGLTVTLSVAPASAGVCAISGASVSLVGSGTCTIDASQPGNGSYQAAPPVPQSFTVGLATQTIGFTTTPPPGATAGDPDYVIGAAATSGLAVVFTPDASSAGVCTVSGSSVSLIGTGTCTIDADQPGDGGHQAAPRVQQSFVIGGPPVASVQSINFTTAPPAGAVVGGSAYTVGAAASSGLAITFSVDASSAGVCAVSGSTVSFTGAGTCTIDANQAGDPSYQAAPQVQQSFTVALATQTIGFTSSPPAGAIVGGSGYTVTASATSGLAVAFALTAGSSGVCTLSGSTVSFVGAGTCTVNADQGGNGSYQAAPQAQQSFTVAAAAPPKSAQSITFTSAAPSGAVVGGAAYHVTANASSSLAVTFTLTAGSAGVCTLSGSTVSLVGAGTCTINANQPGNGSYLAAPQVQQSFTVGLATQSISFTSSPPASAVAGGAAYTVTATATSGLAPAFSLAAGSAGVCTIAGSTVSLVGAGTCTIRANQAGNASYQAAPQVQQSFTVAAAPPPPIVQSITFTSSAPAGAVVGGSAYTVAATASSGLAVTFSLSAGSAGVCTISGSTVSFVGAGTCTVRANQAGNASYQAAPQVQQSFTVGLASQTISFTSPPPSFASNGGPTYHVTATSTSGLTVAFSIDPTSAGVCTLSGSTVSFVGAGTCKINANQSGNATCQAATQVQQSFIVARGSQTITITSSPPNNVHKHSSPYTISATASSGLTVVFTVGASSAGVCSVSGTTVSFAGKGTCTIYADQPGNANFFSAPQAYQTFTVK